MRRTNRTDKPDLKGYRVAKPSKPVATPRSEVSTVAMGFRILRLILVTCFCPAAHGQVSNSSKEVFALAGPTNAQGYLELGFEYYEEKAFKEAVGPLQKAASLEPTNYQAHLYLGFTHYY